MKGYFVITILVTIIYFMDGFGVMAQPARKRLQNDAYVSQYSLRQNIMNDVTAGTDSGEEFIF